MEECNNVLESVCFEVFNMWMTVKSKRLWWNYNEIMHWNVWIQMYLTVKSMKYKTVVIGTKTFGCVCKNLKNKVNICS